MAFLASSLSNMLEAEKARRNALKSLHTFVQQAWHVVEPANDFVDSWHIRVICEHLEAITQGDIRRLLINIPPRHSKSLIVSVLWPMWEWLHQPAHKYLCASYSGSLAIRDNLKARRLVQSPWYQTNFGHLFTLVGDQNAKQKFENNKTGYRMVTSIGGATTGEGGSRLILDDPHNALEAQSAVRRESTVDWFDMGWSTRMNQPKQDAMVVVMQRLHERDVSGRIIKELLDWEHICIPAEYDGVRRRSLLGEYDPRTKEGELICPERFGEKEIADLKRSLHEYGVAGQLQQNPLPAKGGILKSSCFGLWPADAPLPYFEYVIQSYDCAFTEKTNGDPTACTVWGVFTHNGVRNALLIDAWSEHLAYPALRAKAIAEWGTEYGTHSTVPYAQPKRADMVIVEAKASGQSLLQDFRLAKIPAVGYNPHSADKISRAHITAPILEQGLLWIPESRKTRGTFATWAQPFVEQVKRFPVAEHDDYVDTLTQAVIYLKNAGWFILPQAFEESAIPHIKRTRENPYGV